MNQPRRRAYYLDYLRASLSILIVYNHGVRAYTNCAIINHFNCTRSTWYVADHHQNQDIFNSTIVILSAFVIPLFFLVSGIFLESGLRKYGFVTYMKRRAVRLGFPLLLITFVLCPLAGYLSCLQAWIGMEPVEFVRQTFSGRLRVDQGWFLWLLLVFEMVTALWWLLSKQSFYGLGHWVQDQALRSLISFCGLIWIAAYLGDTIGALLTFPTVPSAWRIVSGPFVFVDRRYLTYFIVPFGEWEKNPRL
jgi:surface polysaccharide O-acyltransferase-like enzyme